MTALNIITCDKKYTVIQETDGSMRFLRYGHPWPAADAQFAHVGIILTLAQDLREAREVIKDLMDHAIPVFPICDEVKAAIARAEEFLK